MRAHPPSRARSSCRRLRRVLRCWCWARGSPAWSRRWSCATPAITCRCWNTTTVPAARNWTLYGGDTYTELGGFTQKVGFDPGQYFNPGPWRLPYHHQAILHYVNRLNVPLEPFTQVNYNAYIHSTEAFGGKPIRYRELQADFQGHVAELLAKSTRQNALDQTVSKQDQEILLAALKSWGALDENYGYSKGLISAERRGYLADPGGGLATLPVTGEPLSLERAAALTLVGGDRLRPQLRNAEHDLPTQGRHGPDRSGIRQGAGTADPVQLQGHRHQPDRKIRHRDLCRCRRRAAASGLQRRTGASAPSQPRC